MSDTLLYCTFLTLALRFATLMSLSKSRTQPASRCSLPWSTLFLALCKPAEFKKLWGFYNLLFDVCSSLSYLEPRILSTSLFWAHIIAPFSKSKQHLGTSPAYFYTVISTYLLLNITEYFFFFTIYAREHKLSPKRTSSVIAKWSQADWEKHRGRKSAWSILSHQHDKDVVDVGELTYHETTKPSDDCSQKKRRQQALITRFLRGTSTENFQHPSASIWGTCEEGSNATPNRCCRKKYQAFHSFGTNNTAASAEQLELQAQSQEVYRAQLKVPVAFTSHSLFLCTT